MSVAMSVSRGTRILIWIEVTSLLISQQASDRAIQYETRFKFIQCE